MKSSINEKWDIICKIMKEFDDTYHKIATYYNLSDSSFWILYALYQKKEGCTQKELCTDWYISKQTINSSIMYLQNKGYISLKYEESNRKYKRVCITDKGLEIAKQTVGKVTQIEDKAFKNIDEKEMDIAINFFKKQLKSLKDETAKEIKGDL